MRPLLTSTNAYNLSAIMRRSYSRINMEWEKATAAKYGFPPRSFREVLAEKMRFTWSEAQVSYAMANKIFAPVDDDYVASVSTDGPMQMERAA